MSERDCDAPCMTPRNVKPAITYDTYKHMGRSAMAYITPLARRMSDA